MALNATLEEWIEARRVILASMGRAPSEEKEIQKCKEALILEALERSLELEQLEMRECQVTMAEDVVTVRKDNI